MLLEPLHSLQERTLLGIHGDAIIRVAAHGKAMLHAAVQVDLVRQAQILQDHFALVSLLGREDRVGLGSRDGQRSLYVFQLLRVDEGRVCGVGDVELSAGWLEVSDHVFAAEAVAYAADFLRCVSFWCLCRGGGCQIRIPPLSMYILPSRETHILTLQLYFVLISTKHESMIGSTVGGK